jgi:myosin-5
MTVTVDDVEFAPAELQNQTLRFSYYAGDGSSSSSSATSSNNNSSRSSTSNNNGGVCCVANAWWQPQNQPKQQHPLTAGQKPSVDDDDNDAECSISSVVTLDVGNGLSNVPPDDLTQLEQLHEPAVVYCLMRRYERDEIYTYTGKILLALNPFRPLPDLYSPRVMERYSSVGSIIAGGEEEEGGEGARNVNAGGKKSIRRKRHRSSRPHIFAIARDAWTSMQISKRNQSILVSGESGSGKTVTTKICLRYLAERSTQQKQAEDKTTPATKKLTAAVMVVPAGVEQQVLQSNPILESFGNARTVRNDNSSRFGKLILLQFTSHGCLASANIETYLLEKVRLISQAGGERNFHVFYEILAGLPQAQRRDLQIGNRTAKDFKMTAQSGTYSRRDGVDDRDTFRELLQAFETVGFSRPEQDSLFQIACGLLHASNLTFVADSGGDNGGANTGGTRHQHHADEQSVLDRSNPSLRHVTQLLGFDVETLNEALTKCRIEARGEVLYKNLTSSQATKATEALIKVTYGAVFHYIVRRINESMVRDEPQERAGTTQIGILDIFGFESLETNSFEQLCINYCNEALQQQFNRFVFKLEQQEYQNEGIEWSFIEFPDNQDVLDLIEKKHDGLLSILDEQCRLARCTDATFARAVYEKCTEHPRLEASAQQKGSLCFAIFHYAGWVEYDTANFVEKNKDELPKEAVMLLESSSHPILTRIGRDLAESVEASRSGNVTQDSAKKRQLHRANSSLLRDTVGIQFNSQLRALRVRIESTEPHYVRCLKPNDELVPRSFQPSVIADQLTCAGVLEAIRVSRVGFPHRYYHEHFVERYSILASSEFRRFHLRGSDACRELVELLTPQLVRLLETESSVVSSPVKCYRGNE